MIQLITQMKPLSAWIKSLQKIGSFIGALFGMILMAELGFYCWKCEILNKVLRPSLFGHVFQFSNRRGKLETHKTRTTSNRSCAY